MLAAIERMRAFHMGSVEFYWCPRCQRTYPEGAARLVDGIHRCFYTDCRARVGSHVKWSGLRTIHPQLPESPIAGIVYELRSADFGKDREEQRGEEPDL